MSLTLQLILPVHFLNSAIIKNQENEVTVSNINFYTIPPFQYLAILTFSYAAQESAFLFQPQCTHSFSFNLTWMQNLNANLSGKIRWVYIFCSL